MLQTTLGPSAAQSETAEEAFFHRQWISMVRSCGQCTVFTDALLILQTFLSPEMRGLIELHLLLTSHVPVT